MIGLDTEGDVCERWKARREGRKGNGILIRIEQEKNERYKRENSGAFEGEPF